MPILDLADGRSLGYAQYGDPHGRPLFLFHGMPGSRFFRPSERITGEMGVRLITPERPGYGNSTYQAGRKILDWPRDVKALADALKLDKFAVAGHSGGGPYALACAFAMPERISHAATICGVGPVDTPNGTRGMDPINQFGFRFGRYISWPVWRGIVWLAYRRKLAPALGAGKRRKSLRPAADQLQMDLLDVRDTCIESEKEAFRPGLEGFARDAWLLTRPWGFRLEETRIPVQLWHGTADNMTPFPMALNVAAKLADCQSHFFKDEAHLLIFPHWKDILTELIME
jgi:pimeloyl-ACP methyl ester carboxylesterase